jgi:DNA-binding response OmpR family regulator
MESKMSNLTLQSSERAALRLPTAASPYRILHIEDDVEVARVTRVSLELQGYECRCATDGVSGLEMIQSFQPHLILLDIMLPGMSGKEVLDAIRSQSDVPVVIVSALVNDNFAVQDLQGANDHLGKPFMPAELTRRTKALLTQYYEA